MPIMEAAAVVTTLRNATDLIEKVRGSDNKEELRTQASALADMLFSARASAIQLLEEKALLVDERARLNERIQSLQSDISRLVDFGDKSEKYERIQTAMRKFVYREKNPPGGKAGAPYFCPKCFLDEKISILQGRGKDEFHTCASCKWGEYL